MSVMSPWDNIAHMAGAYATNFVQLPPVRMSASIDVASDSVKLAVDSIDQHRLLYFNMQPFTSQKKIKVHQPVLLSSDTRLIKIGEPVQMPVSGMGRFLNTVYSSERPETLDLKDFWNQARGVVGFPMLFANMEPSSFETVMNSLNPVTIKFSLSTASKTMGLMENGSAKDTLISKILNSLDKITSLGKTPVMAAFKFFGLFGSDEPTTENPPETTPTNNENNTKSHEKSDEPSPRVISITYDSPVGSFNASDVNPFANSVKDNAASYLLGLALSNIYSGNAAVYSVDIQSTNGNGPIDISTHLVMASTLSKRVNRYGLFVKKDQSQTKLTAVHEDPIDLSVDLKRSVNEDLQHNIFLDLVHSTPKINFKTSMKVKLGVSRNELGKLRNSPLLDHCSQEDTLIEYRCQQLREQTQQISFANVTVYYNNEAKELERMVVRYLNAAKLMIPRTEEKPGEGVNSMSLLLDVDQNTRSVDMVVTSPVTSAKIHRLPLSKVPMTQLVEWATQPDSVAEYCGISTKRFKTFDGAETPYNLKDGWNLVLHDRSRKYGISVLAKPTVNQQNNSSNTMQIEVNKDDQDVVRVEEGPKVFVNGEYQQMDVKHPVLIITRQGREVMHIMYTPDSSVRIQLPNDQLELRYTDSSLVVRAGSSLQGRLCGICGAYSNTGAEQYLTAKGHAAKSAQEFAASFHLRGNETPDD